MKRQSEREGGQFLILSPKNGLAADLSTLPNELPSADKVTESSAVAKETAGNISETAENVPGTEQNEAEQTSALDRIPKNELGELVYEQTDAETAWDAIMEQTEGDAEMAAVVVASTIADKKKTLDGSPQRHTIISRK